ncbi:MAG TPA: cupredoxin domain-containing protein [Stellaceae bacterium]|nr:cupredoxin domain-containing protein [Stellaceae bacterium]
MRILRPGLIAVALLASSVAFAADEPSFELALQNHKFQPAALTIPAGKRVKLTVKNLDPTPAEFESHDFKAEKVIPAGKSVILYVGPLEAGSYGFFDDFHKSQTTGTLIAK